MAVFVDYYLLFIGVSHQKQPNKILLLIGGSY